MSWAEIKKAINSDLGKPLNELIEEIPAEISPQINALKSLIGQANPTASNKTTVMNYLKVIEGLSSMSAIKSIQRGVATSTISEKSKGIAISTVNPNKCFVVINNALLQEFRQSGDRFIFGAYVISLTATVLTLGLNYSSANYNADPINQGNVSWQVIEFY